MQHGPNPPGGAEIVTKEDQIRQEVKADLHQQLQANYKQRARTIRFQQGRYKILGITENASLAEIEEAYHGILNELNNSNQPDDVKTKLSNAYLECCAKYNKNLPLDRPAVVETTVMPILPHQPVPASAPVLKKDSAPAEEPRPPAYAPDAQLIDEEKVREHVARRKKKKDPKAENKAKTKSKSKQPSEIEKALRKLLFPKKEADREKLLVNVFCHGDLVEIQQIKPEEIFSQKKYLGDDGKLHTLISLARYHNNQAILDYCYHQALQYIGVAVPNYFGYSATKNETLTEAEFSVVLLHLAVQCNQGHEEIDKLLSAHCIHFGEGATWTNKILGASLLASAVIGSYDFKMASYLCAKGISPNSLFVTYFRDPNLERQAKYQKFISSGMQLVHVLAAEDDFVAMRVLCDLGVHPNVTFRDGCDDKTPLLLARNVKTALPLLECKADPNATCADGTSALLNAAKNKDVEFLEVLLQHGANADVANKSGELPIIAALTGIYEPEKLARMLRAAQVLLENRKKPYKLTKKEYAAINALSDDAVALPVNLYRSCMPVHIAQLASLANFLAKNPKLLVKLHSEGLKQKIKDISQHTVMPFEAGVINSGGVEQNKFFIAPPSFYGENNVFLFALKAVNRQMEKQVDANVDHLPSPKN